MIFDDFRCATAPQEALQKYKYSNRKNPQKVSKYRPICTNEGSLERSRHNLSNPMIFEEFSCFHEKIFEKKR